MPKELPTTPPIEVANSSDSEQMPLADTDREPTAEKPERDLLAVNASVSEVVHAANRYAYLLHTGVASDDPFAHFKESSPGEYAQANEYLQRQRRFIAAIMSDENALQTVLTYKKHRNLAQTITNIAEKIGETDKEFLRSMAFTLNSADYRSVRRYLARPANTDSLLDSMAQYAKEYFRTKYVFEQLQRVRQLMAAYFPQFATDIPIKVNLEDNQFIVENGEHGVYKEEDGTEVHKISVYGPDSLDGSADIYDSETKGVFGGTYEFKRGNHDLVLVFHEYVHAIYEATHPLDLDQVDKQTPYKDTADYVLNEGFAVLSELIFCDQLIDRADALGLDDKDIADFKEWKRQRLARLQHHNRQYKSADKEKSESGYHGVGYTDGALMMHKIYAEKGIQGVVDFMNSVDRHKAMRMLRKSEEYKDTIKSAEKSEAAFSKI